MLPMCSCQRTIRILRLLTSRPNPTANHFQVVGVTGVEPVTLRLSSACSNQLSYTPDLEPSIWIPKAGGAEEIRTPDLQLAKLPLCQLSYSPTEACRALPTLPYLCGSSATSAASIASRARPLSLGFQRACMLPNTELCDKVLNQASSCELFDLEAHDPDRRVSL